MNKKKIKLLAFLIVLGSTSFILSFLILPPPRALAEEDEKKVNLVLNLGLSMGNYTLSAKDLSVSTPFLSSTPPAETPWRLAFGIDFLYDVIEYISLGAGLMFIQKGGEFTTTVYDNGRRLSVKVKNNFDYLAIPILVHFHVNEIGDFILPLFALFSLEPSFLLLASAETTVGVGSIVKTRGEDITDDLGRFDFGIGFGAGIKFSSHFSFQVKYILGLTNIARSLTNVAKSLTNIAKSGEVEMKHRAFVILLGFSPP
jgi:hypothetical protein